MLGRFKAAHFSDCAGVNGMHLAGAHRPSSPHIATADGIAWRASASMLLMAPAHLAVVRPGWDYALGRIALRCDYRDNDGTAEMYEQFKACTRERIGHP
jgi:hypothetical protein